MALKVYGFETCPYCQRVYQFMNDNDLFFERVDIDPWERSVVEELSGQRQVPVLEDTYKDKVIPDSAVIIQYLTEYYIEEQ